MATISLLPAALARVFFLLATGGRGARPGLGPTPPVSAALAPGLIAFALVLIAVVVDWRRSGRPHAAYVAGGAALLAMVLLHEPVSRTAAWQGFALWASGFAA